MYPVALLAGGLGTRMARRTGPRLPKALLAVAGRPFIDLIRSCWMSARLMLDGRVAFTEHSIGVPGR